MSQVQVSKNQEFIEKLQAAKEEGKISNWNIQRHKVRRSNVYVEKDYTIESLLNSKREEIVFSINKEFEDSIGESSFNVSENDSIETFEKELEDAIFICSTSKSKKYEPIKKDSEGVDDSDIDYSIFYDETFFEEFEKKTLNVFVAEKLDLLKRTIESQNGKVVLNSFEFFNSIIEHSVESSEEIRKEFKKNKSYMEFILSGVNGDNEIEHITYQKINDIYKFDFETFFNTAIENVLSSLSENKAEDFKGKVILRDYSAFDFFVPSPPSNPLTNHCSARLKFQGISKYEIGEKVINSNLDKITLYSNPLLSNNESSMPYDEDGVSAKRICLIREGVFEQFFANKKHADYLGIKQTGPFGVVEIDGGSKNYNELYEDEDEIIEIVSFAWFNPDIVSGDFSAEIRQGYKIKNGVKTPFKGGLFTGNVFKILEDVELSKELIEEAGYYGPKVLKFHKGEIVGM